MSYVCAYSFVQLDKSRVEKEFTYFLQWCFWDESILFLNNGNYYYYGNERNWQKRTVIEYRHTGAHDDKKTKSTNWTEKSWVNNNNTTIYMAP